MKNSEKNAFKEIISTALELGLTGRYEVFCTQVILVTDNTINPSIGISVYKGKFNSGDTSNQVLSMFIRPIEVETSQQIDEILNQLNELHHEPVEC
ncbi:hypothetical protein [Chitinophaga nivalis]|uniref:Uncharacterized protein n=1 Tax=Chitinophaga nivalis TaxID=2991709 RepID=A0ABT3IJ61_9BACT|nr:hypothetical protein [Chitinophaga nivalis]MCW3466520.1 hypothetical protein [Chitinophaga nivalis]MCW3483789.1 hypothetical protein [Chitinophaga nivalis]